MVPDPIEGLAAEVQRGKHHVGAPYGVIEAVGKKAGERLLGRVAPGTVSAVVSECDRLGERDVET